MKFMGVVAGLFLIFFGTIMFLYALPSLTTVTQTGTHTTWENSSTFVVSAVGITGQAISFLPFLFFFMGIATILYSLGG